MFKWACLMVSGMPLRDEVRTALALAALRMIKSGENHRAVKSEDCEGIIRTEFRESFFGSFSGVIFEADVESEKGHTKTRFLFDPETEEDEILAGTWIQSRPERANRAAYN
jgi:hypothetical protein